VEIRAYLKILWRRKWIIVGTVLITTFVVILGTLQMPPVYKAVTKLRIQTLTSGASDYVQYDIRYTVRIVNTYIEIATSGPVLEDLKERLNLDQLPPIEIRAVEDTELLQIIAQSQDPEAARQIANTLAQILVERGTELFGRDQYLLPEEYQAADQPFVYIVEPAIRPETAVGPNRAVFALVGAGLGLLGGGGLAFLFDNLDTKLYDTQTIAAITGLPILARIPEVPKLKRTKLLFVVYPYSEILRYLRTRVLNAAQKSNLRTLMVTSAQPAEGKSTIITALALSLAQIGHKVVLVDADLRLPTVHEFFDIDRTRGLSTVLQGQMSLSEVIQEIQPTLHIIASGVSPSPSAELLNSAEMLEVLQELSQRYDFVLLDAPAVLAAADALVLAPKVDGVLLVARRTQIKQQEIESSLSMLAGVGINPMGLVVNSAEPNPSTHYARYYIQAGQFQEQTEVSTLSGNGFVQPTLSAAEAPSAEDTAARKRDPLSEIKGIGPALEQALYELGILTFDQLASQDPSTLARKLGPFLSAKRICKDGWIEQARSRLQHAPITVGAANEQSCLQITNVEKVASGNGGVE
jgi:succinoglycan biosynthesis transport protein ExoP